MLCTHLCSVTQDLLRSWFVSFQIIDQDSENEVQDGTVAKGDQLEQDIDEETDEDSFDHVLKALRHGYDIYIYIYASILSKYETMLSGMRCVLINLREADPANPAGCFCCRVRRMRSQRLNSAQ